MFSRLEWMIAGRYMRARRKEGAISIVTAFSLIGIFLGVGALIVVMSVMNGVRTELVNQILGAQPHVTIWRGNPKGIEGYEDLGKALEGVPGVTRAAPFIRETVMATGPNRRSTGVQVRGLAKEHVLSIPKIANPEWSSGSLDDFEDGVAVGEGVARQLGLYIGDKVTVQTAPNRDTVGGRINTKRTWPVVYIFRSGYYPDDNGFFFVPIEKAQGLANRRGHADGIEVNVEDPDALEANNADPQSQAIIGRLTTETIGYPQNWRSVNGGFIAALDAERAAMFVVLSLVILVAAFNIISGLAMLVKEKGPNIGIMRTFGMRRSAVLRVFMICGMSIGVIGTALGVVGGILFTLYINDIRALLEALFSIDLWPINIRGFSEIPTIIHTSDVVNTVIVALVLSLVATWYPARRAARMDPVEALRYE